MFTKRRLIAAGAAIAVAVSITAVLAQTTSNPLSRGDKGHWGHRGAMGRVFGQLGLTDAQKTQIKQVRANHKATVSDLRSRIRTKMQAVRQAEQNGAFD